MKLAFSIATILATSLQLAALSQTVSAGEVFYRWTNERGHVVHSDRPPPTGIDYEVISTESRFIREVDGEEGAVPLNVKSKPGNEFQQVDTAKVKIEKNPEYCQRARDNLEVLDSSVKIQMRDDQGELRDISDEERDIQRKKATDTIAIHCD